jgi:hypothetical protein
MGLAFTGQGAELQGGGNLKVGVAEGRLERDGGEPDPAQLGGCLDDSLGLLWGQRAQQSLLLHAKYLLEALVLGGGLGAGREGFGCEDRG